MALQITTPDKLEYQYYPISGGLIDFKVKAASDANILLTEGPRETENMYQVHIGVCNAHSVIRRGCKHQHKAIVKTPAILKESEARGFWIAWSGGSIAVGKEGENDPFISYNDTKSINITHYGISTGRGAAGKWNIKGIKPTEISTLDTLHYQYYSISCGSIHFTIKAAHDVQVALTDGTNIGDSLKHIFEIFIGAYTNTKTIIRKNGDYPDEAIAYTPDILSEKEARGFWIKWDGASIAVGKEGETQPLIQYNEVKPVHFTHYGICTGWGASGDWTIKGSKGEKNSSNNCFIS